MADLGYATGGLREPETSEESLLLSRLKRIEMNSAGVFAVHLHLSKLRASNRQPHFITIATRSFDNLVENHEATAFPLHNSDIVLICRNVPVDDADAAIDKVRSLFGEDPLVAVDDDAFEDAFSTWYDLSQPEDFSTFTAVANDLAVEAQRSYQQQAETKVLENKEKGEPLGGMNLAAINQNLQGTRVADLIRNQICLEMGPGGPGNVVFREHYISMAELKKRIAPEVNLFASPWLFQYLTETLDKRMLAVLGNRDFDTLPFTLSLNLNVSTVLSREFQKFHQSVGKNTNKVVVEMQVLDIIADMNTFGYARDSLQERGYRVVVDGLNPLSLQFFDPGLLKSDFVKINWDAEYEGDVDPARMTEMREVITSTGKDSVILARVDTEQAIKWGLALGISRFQGFYIDDLMAKIADVKEQQAKAAAKKKAAAKAAAPALPPAKPHAKPTPAQPARPAAPPRSTGSARRRTRRPGAARRCSRRSSPGPARRRPRRPGPASHRSGATSGCAGPARRRPSPGAA